MPTEHGDAQLGGLRREHLVAAAMVATVTVVLGFASGIGVRDAGAAAVPPASPAGPVAGQPGGQQVGPPLASPLPAGVPRPSGMQVGIRPGSQGTAGSASGSGPGFDFAPGFDSDFGSLPTHPPEGGGDPAAPPAGPVATPPQCPPGVLDQLLGLIAQVLGGTAPAQALSASGAVASEPLPAGALVPGAAEVVTLLPIGGGWTVAVVGLVPLLDAVDQRQDARRIENTSLIAQPAPAQAEAAPAAPGDQLAQLAALLSPLGLAVDPVSGLTDPLLAPVLGSLGCTGFAPAPPQAVPPQEAIR